jgi:hypothetical protein
MEGTETDSEEYEDEINRIITIKLKGKRRRNKKKRK